MRRGVERLKDLNLLRRNAELLHQLRTVVRRSLERAQHRHTHLVQLLDFVCNALLEGPTQEPQGAMHPDLLLRENVGKNSGEA